MTADPLVLVAELDRADTRLVETVRSLDDLSAPSLCAGWTRGHVLTHLCRNADGFVNLLTWARTGVRTPMYATPTAREEGIQAGADRPLDAQLADLRQSLVRLADSIDLMTPDAWLAGIDYPKDTPTIAAKAIWGRLREVEIHHVDLDAGYTSADWPEAFTQRLLHELDAAPGSDHTVAAKLIGRPTTPRS